MKPASIGFALSLSLAVALMLLPGAAWAHHGFSNGFHAGVHAGHVKAFISHGHPFVHRHFFLPQHPHILHRHHAAHHVVIHLHPRGSVVVKDRVIVVPGHGIFPRHGALFRNPCD